MNEVMASKYVWNSWKLLRTTYGVVAIIVGLDKFFNMITVWQHYVNPVIIQSFPLAPLHFMYLIGIVEILVGLLILSRYTKMGAYIMAFWLLIIAIDLVSMGLYDIAARDIVMAAGALALAWLTDAVCYYCK